MIIAIISMIRDSWGGSEELWYEMAKTALTQGHKVVHLAYEHPVVSPKMQELEELGLNRLQRPGWVPENVSARKRLLRLAWNYLRKKWKNSIAEVFAYNPDIVLYNGTCYSICREKELIKEVQRRAPSIKFFILGHLNQDTIRDISDVQADVVKLAYLLSKKVFFVSLRSIETAKRHLCIDIPNADIIRNPVNLESVHPLPFPSLDQGLRLACVGNLVVAHKGQDLLLDALSRWDNKNWILNLYGAGQDRDYLEELAKYLGLQSQVVFHGKVADIREVWKGNHLLLMPSHMEGMPLAVVEAMICGRVCIASNVGGISEWIRDGENGFIISSPTVREILRALERAYALREKWPELSLRAHHTALELYDPHAGASLLNRIIAP